MARTVEAVIGTKHGETCTCTPLDPVTATVQPVLVNRECPGQREMPRSTILSGAVIITWPRATGCGISAWGATVHDVETGAQWLDVLSMRITVNPRDNILTADIERLIDEDGNPGPARHGRAVPTEDGSGYRTAVFRYVVAEMRIAEEA